MPKLAPPPPVMYALNSDQLQVGDWIMYMSRVESSAEPQARVGQIIGLHPGGELDQLCCRRYLRKSDLRTSAQLQQFNSLVVPDVIHEFSYGEEVLIQEYAEVVPVASYLEKCFVMYTSLREQGYPSPKYWREPMPLFVSHAVLQAKGVVYKELKAWEKSVVKPYRGDVMVKFKADNRKAYRDEMETKRQNGTVLDPWFKDHFEATYTYKDYISPNDLHQYWRLSHPQHPFTAAQTVERAMCAFKKEGVVQDQETGGIRFLKLKEKDGGVKASELVETTVGNEEAEAWLIANYLPSFSLPPASVRQTDLWASYARYLTEHKMTTSLSTADFFNKLCPTVFGKSVRAEAVLPPKGGQASFVVTGIERRKRSKDKIGDDETAAVDLVRWFCTNMELDPSNRLLLEEPWDAYCSWHPSPPSLPRRAIEPTKFAGYLSAIRPEIPEVVKLLGGMMTLYGVKLRNEWDPVDLTRAIGRDVGAMRRVKSEAVLPFSTEVKLSPASAGTALWKVGDPKKVGDLRRKSEGEVESAESPDTKKRRKDSGFHEKAVEASAGASAASAGPSAPRSSTGLPVILPAPHPSLRKSVQGFGSRALPPSSAPSATKSTDMARSTSLPTRLSAAAAPSPSSTHRPPPSAMQRGQTSQGHDVRNPPILPPPSRANYLAPAPIPIPPPQLPPPSAIQLLARSPSNPSTPRTPAEVYSWAEKGSPLQKMELREFMQMMMEADGERAEGYAQAFPLLKEAMIGPDVMLELGTQGLAYNGVKIGCAAKIIMALRGDLTRA